MDGVMLAVSPSSGMDSGQFCCVVGLKELETVLYELWLTATVKRSVDHSLEEMKKPVMEWQTKAPYHTSKFLVGELMLL